MNKNKKAIENKEKAAQQKFEDIQLQKDREEAAAAAKKFKEEAAREAAAEAERLEAEAKAKVKAAAEKAAREAAAKAEVEAKAKALKDLQEQRKYYQDQLDAATTEDEKAAVADQLAEIEGSLVGANEDNAEAAAEAKKFEEEKAREEKAAKERAEKEKKAAAKAAQASKG